MEPCGVDGCADVGFRFGGPHCAIAVGDLSLDHARAEFALRGVVGGVDLARIVAKGQKLVSRAPDFGLQFPGEIAFGRCGQKRFELFFQLSFLPRERQGGEIGDGAGEVERLSKPSLNRKGRSSEPCSYANAVSRARCARQV